MCADSLPVPAAVRRIVTCCYFGLAVLLASVSKWLLGYTAGNWCLWAMASQQSGALETARGLGGAVVMYSLAGEVMAVVESDTDMEMSRLVSLLDREIVDTAVRVNHLGLPRGIRLASLLRNGWCIIEHGMCPLRLHRDMMPVDARLTLTWVQQECSLGCVIRGPVVLDPSIFEIVGDMPLAYADLEGSCRDFAHRVQEHMRGRSFQDCLLYWISEGLLEAGDSRLIDHIGLGNGLHNCCLVIEIDLNDAKKEVSSWIR